MLYPVITNSIKSQLMPVLNPVQGLNGSSIPRGAILYYDADMSERKELARKGHDLEALVLGDQYEIQPDGSFLNIGANVPIDTFGDEKWLRSCGAVENKIPNTGRMLSGWLSSNGVVTGNSYISNNISGSSHQVNIALGALVGSAKYLVRAIIRKGAASFVRVQIRDGSASHHLMVNLITTESISSGVTVSDMLVRVIDGDTHIEFIASVSPSSTSGSMYINSTRSLVDFSYQGDSVSVDWELLAAQVTQTSYPVPYTPPGTTMPASNATTTNGNWFTLADGSPVWKALSGGPMTLATRVWMGVGSGDVTGDTAIIAQDAATASVQYMGASNVVNKANDKSGGTLPENSYAWPRDSIIRRVTQVNTAGTQFRVGYMIEGTHTTIQWSSWMNFDGSFGPSTLYRLMLGFNNAYPMWFNKIAAWRKQVTDSEIMEALS